MFVVQISRTGLRLCSIAAGLPMQGDFYASGARMCKPTPTTVGLPWVLFGCFCQDVGWMLMGCFFHDPFAGCVDLW